MIDGDRIRERLRAIGLSQSALARRVGVSPQAINKLVKGETQDSAKLYQIAKELGTTPEYLTRETDDHQIKDLADRRPPSNDISKVREPVPDVVEIRELDLTFGFGATYLDVPVTETMRPFGRDFIRQHTRAKPEELFFAQGIGDSMFPTLLDSDVLLIDTSQKVVNIAAKVWAVSYGGMGMVKRISPAKGGGVMLHSDNPAIPDQIAYDGEMQVLGRVVAFFRKM